MEKKRVFLKPNITEKEIELINRLIAENPSWGRTKFITGTMPDMELVRE